MPLADVARLGRIRVVRCGRSASDALGALCPTKCAPGAGRRLGADAFVKGRWTQSQLRSQPGGLEVKLGRCASCLFFCSSCGSGRPLWWEVPLPRKKPRPCGPLCEPAGTLHWCDTPRLPAEPVIRPGFGSTTARPNAISLTKAALRPAGWASSFAVRTLSLARL